MNELPLTAREISSLIHDALELVSPEELSARINEASHPYFMQLKGTRQLRRVRVTVEYIEP